MPFPKFLSLPFPCSSRAGRIFGELVNCKKKNTTKISGRLRGFIKGENKGTGGFIKGG